MEPDGDDLSCDTRSIILLEVLERDGHGPHGPILRPAVVPKHPEKAPPTTRHWRASGVVSCCCSSSSRSDMFWSEFCGLSIIGSGPFSSDLIQAAAPCTFSVNPRDGCATNEHNTARIAQITLRVL